MILYRATSWLALNLLGFLVRRARLLKQAWWLSGCDRLIRDWAWADLFASEIPMNLYENQASSHECSCYGHEKYEISGTCV